MKMSNAINHSGRSGARKRSPLVVSAASAALMLAAVSFVGGAYAGTKVSINGYDAYHIGDNEQAGWPRLFANDIVWTFSVPYSHYGSTLSIEVFGTFAEHNEVYVNGNFVGHLNKNRSERYYSTTIIHVPATYLDPGANELMIKAGPLFDSLPNGELDDFLLRSISIDVS
jgi:hypothetical protein